MIQKRELKGYWWVPENEDETAGGTAVYSPDSGTRLELFSALNQDPEYLGSDNVLEYDELWGVTTEGQRVSLLNCVRDRYSLSVKDGTQATPSEYLAITTLIGEHIRRSKASFDKFRLELPLLQQWYGKTGIKRSGFSIDDLEIKYSSLEPITADIEDLEIRINNNVNINVQRVGGASIEEDSQFVVEAKNGVLSLDDIFDISKKLQDFLSIATGKEVTPTKLEAVQARVEETTEIEILTSQLSNQENPESYHPLKGNFTFTDISDEFEEVLNTWFIKAEQLEPLYNLYFGVIHHPDMYLQNQFLMLTQAIESYHREINKGVYLSEERFEEYYEDLCDSIPNEFPEDFKAHLRHGTFKYANEYSLRKRLKEVVESNEEIFSNLPWDIHDSINTITNTRNYLSHYEESITPRVEGEDLHELCLILQAIIETIILTEIGIPHKQISERLSKRYSERKP